MEKKGDADRAFFSFLAIVVALIPTWILIFKPEIYQSEFGMVFFWIIQLFLGGTLISALYSAWIKRRK